MRRVLVAVVAAIAVVAVVALIVLWPSGDQTIDASALGFGEQVNATVTAAEAEPCPDLIRTPCATWSAPR